MIYNTDYEKIKRLGEDNYNNSLSNPNQDKIATLGINNYTNNDDIYNIEETLCLYAMKINEIIDILNGFPNYDELSNIIKIILNYLKDIDLSNFYNKKEIDKMLDDIKAMIKDLENIDLENYYTKDEIDRILENLNFIIDAFTKEETRQFFLDIEKVDIHKYYINQEIEDLGTYRHNNKIFYNFKVSKNDDTKFAKLTKCFVGYTPFNFENDIVINGVGRGFAIDDYVYPCAVKVDRNGIISVACIDNAKEIIISGVATLKGTFNDMLLFEPLRIIEIPQPKEPIDFKAFTPDEIRLDLINNHNYKVIEETSYAYKITKNNLNITFTRISGDFDKYEIENTLSLVENIDEIKRILGYTFNTENIDYILSRQEPENYNWVSFMVDNKNIGLNTIKDIHIQY